MSRSGLAMVFELARISGLNDSYAEAQGEGHRVITEKIFQAPKRRMRQFIRCANRSTSKANSRTVHFRAPVLQALAQMMG